MFEQNYCSKDTRWLYWFMAVMIIYALLTCFPETERLAAWVGSMLTAVGVFLFRRSLRRWIMEKVFPPREE